MRIFLIFFVSMTHSMSGVIACTRCPSWHWAETPLLNDCAASLLYALFFLLLLMAVMYLLYRLRIFIDV
ncbi:MAG: hypothetical protein A2176_12660 [Spirochaetes bacterium RBG_13_51_14]|nr:MAG: hypothetical protein A2176_12660 [Spirochaetes bacterium RBG_13_51_14]